jgi:hypothetical protein
MIRLSAIAVFAAVWLSCKGPAKPAAPPDYEGIIGQYAGHFDSGLLSIVVYYVNGNLAGGYDLHHGLRRNLRGTINTDGRYIDLILKEPGDTVTDGTFSLRIDTTTLAATAEWKPRHNGHAQTLSLQKTPGDPKHFLPEGYTVWASRTNDTVLFMYAGGYCDYRVYPRPADPRGQPMLVRGTCLWNGDTCTIDWQRHPYTPGLLVTLLRDSASAPYETSYKVQVLKGQGWTLYGQ